MILGVCAEFFPTWRAVDLICDRSGKGPTTQSQRVTLSRILVYVVQCLRVMRTLITSVLIALAIAGGPVAKPTIKASQISLVSCF